MLMKKADEIIEKLRLMLDPAYLSGMKRYNIVSKNTIGIRIPILRSFAKPLKYNHVLALDLWETEIREARILASYIDNPEKVSKSQMNKWVNDFDTWDICDQCCGNLFHLTNYSYDMAIEWSNAKKEFVKRAGFVIMAYLSIHDKKAEDQKFIQFFDLIIKEANDQRIYVKKAINWSLRQIGKRNIFLNQEALKVADKISKIDSKSAQWIASDAKKELNSEKVFSRFDT